MKTSILPCGALLAGALFLLGCAGPSAATRGAGTLPAVTLKRLESDAPPLDLAALQGQVVLLDFWASWCPPCREILPYYETLHRRYGPRGLVVIGVSLDEREADVRAYLERVPLSFPIAFDPHGQLSGRLGVVAIPASFLIDRDGTIRAAFKEVGPAEHAQLEAQLEALLPSPAGAPGVPSGAP